jgi:L-lactate dehydrogenase
VKQKIDLCKMGKKGEKMKVGIIGAGGVGSACVMASVMRGFAQEIIVIDLNQKRAKGVVTDMQYGATVSPRVVLRDGDYSDLKGATLVMITAGINEKAGGATDRSDPSGRLRLLGTNAKIYQDIIPKIVAVAPQAVLLVVTDPPDPLAQLTRELAGHDLVLSAGTFLDSMRFRWHLGNHFNVSPQSVEAMVVGEHGTSQVFLWSLATIAGVPVKDFKSDVSFETLQKQVEQEVRYANITIIEGINASQYGIGMISARIAEIVVRDEQAVIPIGSYNPRYKTVLSLPSIVGKKGVVKVFDPPKSSAEELAFEKCADTLRRAYDQIDK